MPYTSVPRACRERAASVPRACRERAASVPRACRASLCGRKPAPTLAAPCRAAPQPRPRAGRRPAAASACSRQRRHESAPAHSQAMPVLSLPPSPLLSLCLSPRFSLCLALARARARPTAWRSVSPRVLACRVARLAPSAAIRRCARCDCLLLPGAVSRLCSMRLPPPAWRSVSPPRARPPCRGASRKLAPVARVAPAWPWGRHGELRRWHATYAGWGKRD